MVLNSIKSAFIKILSVIKYIVIVIGAFTLLAIFLSFTEYPFWAYYWLGTHNTELKSDPDVIIVMGGGGMPSPDGLIRCYYAAEAAHEFEKSAIIIAVPRDTVLHEESPDVLMKQELIIRGIDSNRVSFETEGYNTRTQALNTFYKFGKKAADSLSIRIVTSPEHMLRSVAAFRKAGFKKVGGMASFEEAIGEKMLVKKTKGKKDESIEAESLAFRYNTWNYMKYEITVFREWIAIAYYKMRGWM